MASAPSVRASTARNKHNLHLLIDIALASSHYELNKLQYQKYKTDENLQMIARNLVRSNNKITS